jgi:hypothetical protein
MLFFYFNALYEEDVCKKRFPGVTLYIIIPTTVNAYA